MVVSRLDHDANIRPWMQLARSAGADVKWAEVDIETVRAAGLAVRRAAHRPHPAGRAHGGEQRRWHPTGSRRIADFAHQVGALIYVDAVHAAPHILLDQTRAGRRLPRPQRYKWCGPHVAAVAGDPQLLRRLSPDKLVPSSDLVPDRFERGTPPFELYAGVAAAVDHLAGLDSDADGNRRDRVLASDARGRGLRAAALRPPGLRPAHDEPCATARPSLPVHADRVVDRVTAGIRARSPRSWPAVASAPGTATTTRGS